MKSTNLSIILLLLCFYAKAQNPIQNSGNLQIHPGGAISGFGDFTNASTGVLINNGALHLKATVTNDQSAMAAGTGTLHLNGSSAQSMNGLQPFRTFDLVSNNNAGITLSNNLHVSGAHTFTAGLIATSATPNYLIYEAGSSYSGSSDAAHVNGWVKKIGNTNFVFPVGNTSYLRAIELNSLSGSSEFNVRHLPSTPNATSLQLPIKDLDGVEYWSVNRVSGGSASVAMNWDNSKVPFPNWFLADIVAASWNGSAWTDVGGTPTGNVTTTGNLTSNSVSSFTRFTFGSKTFPLPLTLVRFTAIRQHNYTKVSWTTTSEQNVSHFVVERSDNGIHFYSIGQLPARNSGNLENYSLDDVKVIHGTAWYRLRSVDLDTRESISKIVSITIQNDDQGLVLMNNPVKDKIMLRAGSDLMGKFEYKLYSPAGQQVQQGMLNIQNSSTQEITLQSQLPSGTYMLHITNGYRSFEYKLIQL
jgi:hypothetical protein